MKSFVTAAFVVSIAFASSAFADGAAMRSGSGELKPAIRADELRGGGSWKTDGRGARSAQQWELDLQRAGERLTGSIRIADSPLLETGAVSARIRGTRVSGVILDGAGSEVAQFEGAVRRDGMSGTYRDRTGESGEWTWHGPPPE